MSEKLQTAKKTKKKFYNKYIYKISLSIPGTSALRWYDFTQLLDLCIADPSSSREHTWRKRAISDVIDHKEIWINLIITLNSFDNKSFSKRIEGDSVDFYTNDLKLYNDLSNKFADHVRIRFQPKEGTEKTLLASEKEIFVNNLPYGKYQYRAYLKPHKLDAASRLSVANWLVKQQPKITFTDSIKKWLIQTSENWDRRYIHVLDDKTMLMIQLRAPQLVGKVFKYTLNR